MLQAGRRLLMHHPRLGLMILALVLGLRVLIPPGMMPVPNGARGIVVALCDGSGPLGADVSKASRRTITLPTSHPAKTDGTANPGPCAFGVLANAMIGGGEAPALPLAPPLIAPITPALVAALMLAAIARTRPPARAPPQGAFG
ncbi:hypothetical protein [Novosphingobium capsulatum]|uniref:hypothetical protein n=2 Tax=Novosphingobium capsulatum TaxID=13688 RepID=UPI000B01FCDF|nr:hypothetical protein U0041_02275 [Novosphingobium capsulatum]